MKNRLTYVKRCTKLFQAEKVYYGHPNLLFCGFSSAFSFSESTIYSIWVYKNTLLFLSILPIPP